MGSQLDIDEYSLHFIQIQTGGNIKILTGEIKNKVDRIWENFWTGGVTNPLTVIEQFTYLIFIKSLDDKQLQSEAEASILGLNPKIIFDYISGCTICNKNRI